MHDWLQDTIDQVVPLRSIETVTCSIEGAETATGLRVNTVLKRGGNETGERVSNTPMQHLRLQPRPVCPVWNYTLYPREDCMLNG